MSFVGLLLVGKRAKDMVVAFCCFSERASWRSKRRVIGCLIIATALDYPAILSAGQPISPGGSQSTVSKVSDMFSAEQG